MARRQLRRREKVILMSVMAHVINMMILLYVVAERHYRKHLLRRRPRSSVLLRNENLNQLLYENDLTSFELLRMDRYTLNTLCSMLRTTGRLKNSRHVDIEEMVVMFLHILAHHVKNRVIKNRFLRSGETISRHFNAVLNAVIRLHAVLLKTPEPIPKNSTDERWKWFKNCLGALDGTYIEVQVPEEDKPRYRTRKSKIATNVLGVCSQDMQFIFVLRGWEGSAADSRVLRDAMSRTNGLRVPHGYYYLVDAGYMNGEGFLAPYRGQRYHLNDWREGHTPNTPEEFFNMKHSAARNVIERFFGMLKLRWAILRSCSFYPVKTRCKIIVACCLLHNLIRREMTVDPIERRLNENVNVARGDPITVVESSNEWSAWRTNLATQMFNEWRASREGN